MKLLKELRDEIVLQLIMRRLPLKGTGIHLLQNQRRERLSELNFFVPARQEGHIELLLERGLTGAYDF